MAIGAALIPEFDHEMANTRKALERVPEDKFGWKPHEKSGSMIWLAGHVAQIPSYASFIFASDFFDVEGGATAPPEPKSRKELLDLFDQNVKKARAELQSASDEQWAKPWSLKAGEKTFFTQPRVGVIRGMVMNHLIHHRAQLTVYLRMNNVPVPALYGPSGDEQI
jgi:uncharacterized damage-inducible protein DinB